MNIEIMIFLGINRIMKFWICLGIELGGNFWVSELIWEGKKVQKRKNPKECYVKDLYSFRKLSKTFGMNSKVVTNYTSIFRSDENISQK